MGGKLGQPRWDGPTHARSPSGLHEAACQGIPVLGFVHLPPQEFGGTSSRYGVLCDTGYRYYYMGNY